MSTLADKHCVPCRGGTPAIAIDEAQRLLAQLDGWELSPQGHLVKTSPFADFATALDFVNRIAAVAEAEGHHPDVYLAWGKVRLEIWTHAIGGLSESDFVLAAKADRVLAAG